MFLRPLFRLVPDDTRIPFMRGRHLGLLVSALLSLASVVLFFYPGLHLGIDFRGGIVMEIRTPGPADLGKLRAALAAERVRNAFEAAKVPYRYLPSYSPDFNPIEPCWSKLKTRLRAKAARLIRGHHTGFHRAVLTDVIVHLALDLLQLLRRQALAMGEIETQPVIGIERAALRDVIAQRPAERLVQQVRGGVVGADRGTTAPRQACRYGTRQPHGARGRDTASEARARLCAGLYALRPCQ